MRLLVILAFALVAGGLAACGSSPQDRAAKAQERAYEAREEAVQERLRLVDKYRDCVVEAGDDNTKLEACDSYLRAAEALR